ncbi:MAG: hypothetical protein ACE5OZ_13510 [Candidatus Heimdallarchaeota archaeon]
MSEDHNQRLGFAKFQKRGGTQRDGHRQQRLTKKVTQREITIAQARDQLLATNKIKKIIGVFGGGKEATVLVAEERGTGEYVWCPATFCG